MKSFDIIGSGEKAVAIIEVDDSESKNEKKIAEKIMLENKIVKSVLKKTSSRKGTVRLRDYKFVAGDKNTEVLHKEYGYAIKVDPQKVYFSPRESTERQRIAGQVKKNETVMLLFAGVGVFAVAIAKRKPVEKIFAVEINKHGTKYTEENARINKLSHIIVPINADARKIPKEFLGKSDRVIMPLPLQALEFLDVAVGCLKKKKGIINLYAVSEEKNLFKDVEMKIKDEFKKIGKKYRIIGRQSVLPYAPRKWKVRIDIKVI